MCRKPLGTDTVNGVGIVFGQDLEPFAITRQIWIVMFAHAAFDLAAVAIIYWNAETAVAHLVFR